MPDNNAFGLNVSTGKGDGAASVLTWGNLDRTANQLYQEQKQREQRGYNDYLAGESALQKEFANVRSADVPDVVAAYNARKKLKQQMLFDEKIKKDPIQLAKKQQELNIQDAALRQLIAGSQELKETDKSINARKLSHPDDFDNDLVQQHTEDLNLPLRERMKEGRIDSTPYLYKGVDMVKLGSLAKQATGTPKTLPIGEPTVADEGYKIEQKFISRPNNPVQYAENMYKNLQTNKMGQGAATLLNQMSPVKVGQITAQFNAIPDDEFEKRWGVKKSQLVNGVLPDDKSGQYVLLDAMKYAVDNMPTDAKSEFRPNEKFRNDQNADEWDRRNGITSKQADERARLSRQAAQRRGELAITPQPQGNLLDTFGTVQSMSAGKGVKLKSGVFSDKDGNPYTGTVDFDRKDVPSAIYGALKAAGMDAKHLDNSKKFTAIIKDGRIQALKDDKLGLIDRQMIENAQLKYNTEPQKGRQMQFGSGSSSNTTPAVKPTKGKPY